ncbi:MAG: DUF3859 domain-containing protein [Bauldia sp.]
MRALVLFALLLPVAFAAQAETRIDRIDIVDKGIYTIETGQQTQDTGTPTGEITAVETARNVEATTSIAARVGLEFGLRYLIVGAPAGDEISLDFVILYPEPGLRDPQEEVPVKQSRYSRQKKIGDTLYLGYGFDNDWEIVPGTWTFQIWDKDRKLAEQSFTVGR